MTPSSKPVTMVVAEEGGDWLSWAERLRSDACPVVVIEQTEHETPVALARRVRSYVESLETSGTRVDNAVIVGGDRSDSDMLTARSLALRAIVAPMVRRGGGRVVLEGRGRARFSMKGLASMVSELTQGTGVDIEPVAA